MKKLTYQNPLRNRVVKKKGGKKSSKLEMENPNVAGVDLGNEAHYVKVAPHLTEDNIRRFGTFTADLHALVDWLETLQIVANPARRGKCSNGINRHILDGAF